MFKKNKTIAWKTISSIRDVNIFSRGDKIGGKRSKIENIPPANESVMEGSMENHFIKLSAIYLSSCFLLFF